MISFPWLDAGSTAVEIVLYDADTVKCGMPLPRLFISSMFVNSLCRFCSDHVIAQQAIFVTFFNFSGVTKLYAGGFWTKTVRVAEELAVFLAFKRAFKTVSKSEVV